MLLLYTDGRNFPLLQPGCYQAGFQPVAARWHQSSAMLAIGRMSIQTTQKRTKDQTTSLVNDVMLVAAAFDYAYVVVM